MSDDHWYLDRDPKPGLYGWIFKHMAIGAAYAAMVCMAVLFVILLIRAISFILPDDPYAALELGQRALGALV